MTVPSEAIRLVLWGLAVGFLLGLCYDFLRPLRRRHHAPADLVFVLITLWSWIWYSFKICAGDIRFGGTASMGLGILLWLGTASMVMKKVFYWFWLKFFQIFSVLTMPFAKIFKKIQVFIKKYLHMGKKGGTIERVTAIPHIYPEEPNMNKQSNTQRQPAKVWLKLAVLLVIVFCTAALLVIYVGISRMEEKNRDLQQQAQQLEQDNQDLQNYIANKDTDQGIKDVATGELGMVDPDTVIYDFD